MYSFIHLRLKSSYSLCESSLKIPKIVELAEQNQMPAVALTDSQNLFGALEFCIACCEKGIQPLIGCELLIEHQYKIAVLIYNAEGYRNLSQIISSMYLKKDRYKELTIKELEQHSEGLIALSCYEEGFIGQNLLANKKNKAIESIQILNQIFQNRFYMDISRHGKPEEKQIEQDYIQLAYDFNIPIVATNSAAFDSPQHYEAHDALLCIAHGRYVSEDDRPKVTQQHYFKSTEEMRELFNDLPEAIENTYFIAQKIRFILHPINPVLPHFFGTKDEENKALSNKASQGLQKRFEEQDINKDQQEKYKERLKSELSVIQKMEFSSYFLIVSDFIQWARQQKIPVGPGRGSGTGSLIAWSLTITDIDPIRYNLLFERFLNPERISLPDFDIDFCQERRDEVIEYVKKRHGEKRVAHIITFGKLQPRAVLRDTGRALQIPYAQVDEICKLIPFNTPTLDSAIKNNPPIQKIIQSNSKIQKLFKIGEQLEGLYRHASTHAAGIVISATDLENIVPLYREENSNIASTQFSMKYAELAGLLKFDFLGLKTLTVIDQCSKLIKKNFNINNIPLDDPKTFTLLSDLKTVGIFQLEGGGMRDVLSKLKPDRFEDIIALISLYRPGPMDSIPSYISRKHKEEKITYSHPLLEDTLKETYGIMVYQEQVMQIARDLAGYSMGESDLLRRAMGKKIKHEMEKHRKIFIDRAIERDVKKNVAKEIFEQMAKFSGYGFNKSHAAPYALLAYQTAYLKANYPSIFFAVLMTHDSDNTDKLKIYYDEIRNMGIKLLPPCINRSDSHFTVENNHIRYGLSAIKNISTESVKKIVLDRIQNGLFKDLSDFFKRISHLNINKRQIEYLAQAGVFDNIHNNRKQISEHSEYLLKISQNVLEEKNSNQINLFEMGDKIDIPDTEDWDDTQKLVKEYESLGLYITSHPLKTYIPFIESLDLNNETSSILWGILKKKNKKISKNGKPYAFLEITTLENSIEVLIFSEQLDEFNDVLIENTPIAIYYTSKNDRLIADRIVSIKKLIEEVPIEIYFDPFLSKIELICTKIKPGVKTKVILKGCFKKYNFEINIPSDNIDLETRKLIIKEFN